VPYCTIDDIRKLLPEEALVRLTDDEGTGAVDEGRVQEAVAQADSEIDGYCGARYKVPFSTAPGVVKKLSVDIAVYNLYSRGVDQAPPVRAERYQAAVFKLKDIARGLVSLGADPAPDSATGSAAETNRSEGDNVFSRDSLEGF
jgi:phage gp36-like protein